MTIILTIGIVVGGIVAVRIFRQTGQRKLLAVMRHAFDCYAIAMKIGQAEMTSAVPGMLSLACSEMAHIYMHTLPRVASMRASGINRIPAVHLEFELRQALVALTRSAMVWQLHVSPVEQWKTIQCVFGPNATRFIDVLQELYSETERIAKTQLREDGFAHLVAP